MVSLCISCDTNETEKCSYTPNDNAVLELYEEFEAYNATFHNETNATRGFGWLKRLWRTVYADAVGGIIGANFGPWGAVAGATLFSAIVCCADNQMAISDYPMQNTGYNMYADGLNSTVIYTPASIYTDSVGYYHNKILMHLNSHNLLSTSSKTKFISMINTICSEADNMYYNGRENTTNTTLIRYLDYLQFKNLCENPIYATSFETFAAAVANLYADYEVEMNFLATYVNVLCNIEQSQNDGSYAEGVLDIINNSNVDNDMKKRLGDAVITGNASARLWIFN